MTGFKKFSTLCIASAAIFSTCLMSPPLQAKDELKVIALVNSEPITNLELTDRVSYLRRATQLKVSEEILRRDALQGLIADRLKQQFGKSVVPEIIPRLNSAAQKILDGNFLFKSNNFIKSYQTNILEKININNFIFNSFPKISQKGFYNNYDFVIAELPIELEKRKTKLLWHNELSNHPSFDWIKKQIKIDI